MRSGFRGYITSRPLRGTTTPQRVQNLVIRDYASRRGLHYLLSMAEYAMPGSFMMFENILAELDTIEGIIAFSAFMLPADGERRLRMYARVLDAGASLHAALENLSLSAPSQIERFDDLISSALLLDRVPFHGRYVKGEHSLMEGPGSFVRALRPAMRPPGLD